MSKAHKLTAALAFLLYILCGCTPIGEKATSLSIIYGVITILSFVLLVCCCFIVKKQNPWMITLFTSVFIVNVGYWSLSVSSTLEQALFANRIAYLGAVALPLTMLMIIRNVCKIKYNKYFIGALISLSVIVFIIAASPGYSDIYYKSVELETINGVSILNKEYGSWHVIYLFYLLSYFAAMVSTIVYSIIIKRIKSFLESTFLAVAVLVNICVWLLEQLVDINFEFLSISYIASELFFLALYITIQETKKLLKAKDDKKIDSVDVIPEKNESTPTKRAKANTEITQEQIEHFSANTYNLTPTEKLIFNLHIKCVPTKQILLELNIKENTLKYHNKNIYSKLGVNSRKQLREIAVKLNINELV